MNAAIAVNTCVELMWATCLVSCMCCDTSPAPLPCMTTHKSCAMSMCTTSRSHPEHPGLWGSRYHQGRAYRWGKKCVGLHPSATSQSHSFYCNPLYLRAGTGHHDKCHPSKMPPPSTPRPLVSSQEPPLLSKNRARKPGRKLSAISPSAYPN